MTTKETELAIKPRLSLAVLHRMARRFHLGKGLFDYSQIGLFQIPVQTFATSVVEGYSVVPGTIESISSMAKCRKMTDEHEGEKLFTSRMHQGTIWYLLLDSLGKTVGYAWVATTTNLIEDDDRYTLFCSRKQAYIFDTFIQPEERGKHLYKFLLGYIQQSLEKQGRDEFFVLIDKANTVSMHAHGKLGALELETYQYHCLFGLTFQTVRCKQKTRKRIGVFHGPTIFESLVLPSPDIKDFSLTVCPLETEDDWNHHRDSILRLEEEIGDCFSPFHLFSAAHIWWKTMIQDPHPLYLVELLKGKEKKVVGYGVFRLYSNKDRFGHPEELIVFDDLYFMDNCFFIHLPELLPFSIQKIVSRKSSCREIRRVTGADLLCWHRISPMESIIADSHFFSRWAVKAEAEYPMLEINDRQSFFASGTVNHAMHDIQKQQKRIHNAWGTVPEIHRHTLGELDVSTREDLGQQFLNLLRKTWQFTWMQESPLVDTALYEAKLMEYGKLWADSGYLVIYFLDIDSKHIAFLYALRQKNRCWCLMIGYDPDFKTYSPGKTVFLGMLQDMSEQGVQQFHLGGNVVGWKDDWQSCCLQVNLVEFWVNPFFVLVQGVKKVLRRH
jgi:hypothetical protein